MSIKSYDLGAFRLQKAHKLSKEGLVARILTIGPWAMVMAFVRRHPGGKMMAVTVPARAETKPRTKASCPKCGGGIEPAYETSLNLSSPPLVSALECDNWDRDGVFTMGLRCKDEFGCGCAWMGQGGCVLVEVRP